MSREMKLKILTIIPIISEVIAMFFLSSQVPVHYNMSFQVTEYGSKYVLLILGAFVLVFGLFMNWIYKVNMNTKYEAIIYRLSVIALLVFNVINLLSILGSMFMGIEETGLAIIGGADGPTAIFLAGKLDGLSILGIVACGILVIGMIVLNLKKKK